MAKSSSAASATLSTAPIHSGAAPAAAASKLSHEDRGDQYFKNKDYLSAIVCYENALKSEGMTPNKLGILHINLAKCYGKMIIKYLNNLSDQINADEKVQNNLEKYIQQHLNYLSSAKILLDGDQNLKKIILSKYTTVKNAVLGKVRKHLDEHADDTICQWIIKTATIKNHRQEIANKFTLLIKYTELFNAFLSDDTDKINVRYHTSIYRAIMTRAENEKLQENKLAWYTSAFKMINTTKKKISDVSFVGLAYVSFDLWECSLKLASLSDTKYKIAKYNTILEEIREINKAQNTFRDKQPTKYAGLLWYGQHILRELAKLEPKNAKAYTEEADLISKEIENFRRLIDPLELQHHPILRNRLIFGDIKSNFRKRHSVDYKEINSDEDSEEAAPSKDEKSNDSLNGAGFFNSKKSKFGINPRWYTDLDVSQNLSRELAAEVDAKQVMVFGALQPGQVVQQLKSRLDERNVHYAPNRYAIIVNVGQRHWTFLDANFTNGLDKKPTITYVDPLAKNALPPQTIQTALLNTFQVDAKEIKTCGTQFQNDGHNCGPWVVALGTQLVKHNRFPDPASINIEALRAQYDAKCALNNNNNASNTGKSPKPGSAAAIAKK